MAWASCSTTRKLSSCTPPQECIPTSLLKLGADSSGRAVKMFAAVQRYMGDAGDPPTGAAKLDLIAKLLSQARPAARHFKPRTLAS